MLMLYNDAHVSISSLPYILQTRVAAIFVFVSFNSLLNIAGVPALMKEIKVSCYRFLDADSVEIKELLIYSSCTADLLLAYIIFY